MDTTVLFGGGVLEKKLATFLENRRLILGQKGAKMRHVAGIKAVESALMSWAESLPDDITDGRMLLDVAELKRDAIQLALHTVRTLVDIHGVCYP